MACVLTFRGKEYSVDQFSELLQDSLLDELIRDGVIDPAKLKGKRIQAETPKQENKAREDEIFKAKKPTATLNFIDDSKVLSKSITETVVDEDGNTDTREITLAKKQAEIKKEMGKLKQLMDCIYG